MAAYVGVDTILLERINALKREGNDCYCAGTKHFGEEVGNESLRNACILYGQAIEAVMELELASSEICINSLDGSSYNEEVCEIAVNGEPLTSLCAHSQFRPDDELSSLKVTLFLNLAQSNIHLGGYDGATRCCNAALQLCNNPFLQLSDLAPTDEDVELNEPVPPAVVLLAAKALFRRGKCFAELGDMAHALEDFKVADRISPNNKSILDSIHDAEIHMQLSDSASMTASVSAWDDTAGGAALAAGTATATTLGCSTERAESESGASIASSSCTNITAAAATAIATVTAATSTGKHCSIQQSPMGNRKMTNMNQVGSTSGSGTGSRAVRFFPSELITNGGQCWLRKGYWSQTTTDATVYLPAVFFKGPRAAGKADVFHSIHQQWDVGFRRMTVQIIFQEMPDADQSHESSSQQSAKSFALRLEHIIASSDCTWTMETIDNDPGSEGGGRRGSIIGAAAESGGRQYVVLHLVKAPSVEWFPGCEWWDRVFAGDEAIDTMTCTVGADVAQLPPEALDMAEKEHRRFTDMSAEQRALEMDRLTQTKKDFIDAERRTRSAAEAEDLSLGDVPQRAEMLEVLRSHFPKIDFKSK